MIRAILVGMVSLGILQATVQASSYSDFRNEGGDSLRGDSTSRYRPLSECYDNKKDADPYHLASEKTAIESRNERRPLFPLLGEKAREAGYELPLPYGVAATFYYVQRDIDIKNVEVGLGNNGAMHPVNDFLEFDVKTYVRNSSVKLDVWLFPFMNVYGLVGYMENTSKIDMAVTVGENTYRINQHGKFDGETYGIGTVLAGGFLDYFMTFDATYVYSEMDQFDSEFKGSIASLKMGWKGKIKNADTRIWIGGTYWDTEREMGGSIPDVLRYRVLQAPKDPFNYNLGTNVEITKRFNLVLDYGTNFNDMKSFLFAGGFRW